MKVKLLLLTCSLKIKKKFKMKKILLFLIVFTSLNTFAKWNQSMIRVREEAGRTISITIDGMRYNKIGRNITVPNVMPGKRRIKIMAYNSNGYGYRNGIVLYQGIIDVKPGNIYYCGVFNGGMDIEENCCIDDYGHWNNNDNWENWDNVNQCWNNNRNWNDNNNNNNNNYWNNKEDDFNNNYQNNKWNKYQGVMSNSRYLQLIDQVRDASFESSKVTLLNTMLRNTNITTAQLIGVLKELSFESTTLQFAKDNYIKLVDKSNAYMIINTFTFQSSKDDFLNFIGRQK